jgi:DNA-binding Lrp family transcriptional regulator
MDEKNKQLLALLKVNARETTSSLARKLQLSRTAVQERINKLEKRGVIAGYTVKLNKEYEKRLIKTWVVMATKQKLTADVVTALKRIEQVKSLRTISGIYDLIATIQAEDTETIDHVLDQIGAVKGIEKTLSSIELSIKFDR